MISDDTYRSKLQQTIASVRAWTGFVADVAKVDVGDEGTTWHIALTPHTVQACPVELVLRGDQKCDIRLGRETYEDWPIPSLDIVVPLMESIADGRVMTRKSVSAATGLSRSLITLVTLANGTVIEFNLPQDGAAVAAEGPLEGREIHYLPYRRPDARS